jgi:hypothetical protein
VAQDNLIARGWPPFSFLPLFVLYLCVPQRQASRWRKEKVYEGNKVGFSVVFGVSVHAFNGCPDFCYEVSNSDGAGKRHFFRIAEFGANAIKSRRSQDGNPLAIKKSWATRFLNSLVTSVRTKVADLCTLNFVIV